MEFETSTSASAEEQKKRLNSQMGLDVAAKLGLCEDLVDNEDLENLSAREKNVRKRLEFNIIALTMILYCHPIYGEL